MAMEVIDIEVRWEWNSWYWSISIDGTRFGEGWEAGETKATRQAFRRANRLARDRRYRDQSPPEIIHRYQLFDGASEQPSSKRLRLKA